MRLALSYDALKMNGTPARRRDVADRCGQRPSACASLSMTHGPAMSTSGVPPPIVMAPIVTGFTGTIIQDASGGRRHVTGGSGRQAAVGRRPAAPDAGSLCRWLASTKLANSGCGLSGFDLNSGWNCTATNQGWSVQLDDLDELAVRRSSREPQALGGQDRLVQAVELVPVAMPLADEACCRRSGWPASRARARTAYWPEPHRAAELVDAEQVAQLVDDLVRRVLVALGRIGVRQAADVARELDRRPLEAVADAEVRDQALARDLGRPHHAARAARAEPAGHQDAVGAVEQPRAVILLERLRLDPLDVDLRAGGRTRRERAPR